MKKLNILLVAALALAGWSCQDEKNNVPLPSNPQEPVMSTTDLAVTSTVPQFINLPELNAADEAIALGNISQLTNLPEGYELTFVGELGREEEFVHSATFPVALNDKALSVSPDDLEGAYVAAIGKSAKAKQTYIRVAAYASKGDAQVRMGGADVYYLNASPVITPLDLGIVIEDSYGLLGTINGWSVADAVLFDHEGDPYDNPIFTMVVTITDQQAADGWWWKVVPQSTIETGNWVDAANASFGTAVNGSHDLEGNLVPRTDTEDCGAGAVNTPGVYTLTLDMENQTYEFVPMFDYLYMPGNINGWNHLAAAKIPGEIGATVFQGFAAVDGEFKFTDQAGWSGNNYGDGGDGKLSTDGGNLSAAKGLYYVKADIEKLEYALVKIESLGLIGGFNGWGAQEALTPNADATVWTGKITLSAGEEFKVRMNDNWDYNLGGNPKAMTVGGANIVAPAAGTYTVTVDLTNVPYTLTLTK